MKVAIYCLYHNYCTILNYGFHFKYINFKVMIGRVWSSDVFLIALTLFSPFIANLKVILPIYFDAVKKLLAIFLSFDKWSHCYNIYTHFQIQSSAWNRYIKGPKIYPNLIQEIIFKNFRYISNRQVDRLSFINPCYSSIWILMYSYNFEYYILTVERPTWSIFSIVMILNIFSIMYSKIAN